MNTYTEHINHYLGEDNKTLIAKCNALVKHIVLVLGITDEDVKEFDGSNLGDFQFAEDFEQDLQDDFEFSYYYTVIDYLSNCWNGGSLAREVLNEAIILYLRDIFSQE